MHKQSRALSWIVDLLNDEDIPFQVVGGLAARAYGARRLLVDIDIYVPADALQTVATLAGRRVIRNPERHRDECWDLTFMKIDYDGIGIEIAGAEDALLYDREAGRWVPAEIDFSDHRMVKVEGVDIPVMPREQLIRYKRSLGREVDLQDIEEIESIQS